MGLLTKLSKTAFTNIKKIGGNSKTIKTSVQTIRSKAKAVTGGKKTRKSVAKATAKDSSGTIKVAGKRALTVGLVGATALGGAKVYDYIQDVRSKTPEQRQAEQAWELYEDINDKTGGSGTNYSETDPSGLGDDGGQNFFSFYDDIKDQETSKAGSMGLGIGLLAGAGIIGLGYYLYKRKK